MHSGPRLFEATPAAHAKENGSSATAKLRGRAAPQPPPAVCTDLSSDCMHASGRAGASAGRDRLQARGREELAMPDPQGEEPRVRGVQDVLVQEELVSAVVLVSHVAELRGQLWQRAGRVEHGLRDRGPLAVQRRAAGFVHRGRRPNAGAGRVGKALVSTPSLARCVGADPPPLRAAGRGSKTCPSPACSHGSRGKCIVFLLRQEPRCRAGLHSSRLA
mmetsp:Transcript_15425/g.34795  ORF Transcript_15425/g.34795 Transcript_15425/m.34795 type:complete len:218 (+) Transcript_15425:74-727(+)